MRLFEWDEAKAAANKRKHRVAFEDVRDIFDDPRLIDEPDDYTIGEYDEFIRIISARRATPHERGRYMAHD